MTHHKLPVGIQDFEKLITAGYTYVDKTEFVYQLAAQGSPFFLAHPRRFGKSLLISTFAALFSGKRDLFKGLWIENSDWNWQQYPVISLDMSQINNQTPELFERSLMRELNAIASTYHVTLEGETSSEYLKNLIELLAESGKVAVLVDEYDKPLIDQLENLEVAKKNRAILRQFYSILKGQDRYLKFVFLTGVTKFSKVSVFSGMNNLVDISMSEQYSTILGYTGEELERYFALEIASLAEKEGWTLEKCYAEIKEWYNGYQFSAAPTSVFNPFSVLLLLYHQRFDAHWFETGTPTFLLQLLRQREFNFIQMEQRELSSSSFGTFEIEDIPTTPILYQTGYLTIKAYNPQMRTYRLGYPNREVAQAFSESVVNYFIQAKADSEDHLSQLCDNLYALTWNDHEFFLLLQELLALIPYDLYLKQEKHYQSLFYLIIKLTGVRVGAEVHTQRGRMDAVIEMKDKVILFEFKLNQNAQVALAQIREKKYFEIYRNKKIPIYLVGVNFNGHERTLDDWTVEIVKD